MHNNLYPIQQQHLTLLSIVEDNEGIIDEQLDQALQLTQEQFQEQALSVANVYRTLEDREALIKKEIDRLKSLQERTVKAKAYIKDTLEKTMLLFDMREIKGDTLKLSFRKSESVEILDDSAVCDMWRTFKMTSAPDKAKIKAALKAGEEVPGAMLVQNDNLQIR